MQIKHLICALLILVSPVLYAEPFVYVQNRVLVQSKFKPNLSTKELKITKDTWLVDFSSLEETTKGKQKLKELNLSFELDQKAPEDLIPNDPLLSSQWHLPKINTFRAWDSTCASGILIAILDSGVSHHDIKTTPGYNFYSNNTDTNDYRGHGTLVAGSAAGTFNNSLGIAGVASCATVLPLRISDDIGYALFSDTARAITYAADQGAKVINISYANMYKSSSVQSASSYAKSKGAIVVVSAGNTGVNDLSLDSPDVIAVSATNSSDARPSWSSFGSYVDISAPGENIFTTMSDGTYRNASGTSFSAPIVAGTLALMLSANPNATPDQLEQVLEATAVDIGTPGYDIYYGHGRIDSNAAVQGIKLLQAPVDLTPPSITLSPASSTVKGIVLIQAVATDNSPPVEVQLRINSILVQQGFGSLNYSWDTTALPQGSVYTVQVLAKDAKGNISTKTVSYTIAVTKTPRGKNR